jgi:hypothetical protein
MRIRGSITERVASADNKQLPLQALRALALRFAPGHAFGTSGNLELHA